MGVALKIQFTLAGAAAALAVSVVSSPVQATQRAVSAQNWAPNWVSAQLPAYPAAAAQRSLSGYCDVSFRVDRTGAPDSAELTCEPGEVFEESTNAAIKSWRFNAYPGPDEFSRYYRFRVAYAPGNVRPPRQDIVLDTERNNAPQTPGTSGTGASAGSAPAAQVGSAAPSAANVMAGSGEALTVRPDYPAYPMPSDPAQRALMEQRVAKNGEDDFNQQINQIAAEHFRGTSVDLFIYERPGLTSGQRARLDALERSLSGLNIVRGSRMGYANGEIVLARGYATAGRVVDAPWSGTDLEFLQVYPCTSEQNPEGVYPVRMGSPANWGAVYSHVQYNLADDRGRRDAERRGERLADERIREQIRSQAGPIRTILASVARPCTPSGIFGFGQGMGGDMGPLYYLDSNNDFGWANAATGGWNIERDHWYIEADVPHLRRRPSAYYAEYLHAIAEHIDDRALSISLHGVISDEWTFGFLALFDPSEPRPGFHDWEARFIRSNHRLSNGHTLLTYLIERGADPVLLRAFFSQGVLDFDSAMTARNSRGHTPIDLLLERGIAPDILRPDVYTTAMEPSPGDDGMYAFPRPPSSRMIESAIVGDNLQALQWLQGRGADFSAPFDTAFDGPNLTPLALAVALDRPAALEFLLAETDVNARHPETGRTAYFEAYAASTDADGRPVPRLVGGQSIALSQNAALRLRQRLIAAGANATVRDGRGVDASTYWSLRGDEQARDNASTLRARAELEEEQGAMERWRRESRRQLFDGVMEGVVAGLSDAADTFAEDARRERNRRAREAESRMTSAQLLGQPSGGGASDASSGAASGSSSAPRSSAPTATGSSSPDYPAEARAVRPEENGGSEWSPSPAVYAVMYCRYNSDASAVHWYSDIYSAGEQLTSGTPGYRADVDRMRRDGEARASRAQEYVSALGRNARCEETRWASIDVFTRDQANSRRGASAGEIRDRARAERREMVAFHQAARDRQIAANADNPDIVLESNRVFGPAN